MATTVLQGTSTNPACQSFARFLLSAYPAISKVTFKKHRAFYVIRVRSTGHRVYRASGHTVENCIRNFFSPALATSFLSNQLSTHSVAV